MSETKLKFTAHKAGAAGGTGFFGVLFLPVGPDSIPAGLILINAVMAMLGFGEPVDPELVGAAVTVLWGAVGVGVAALAATYIVPNKLKSGSPAGGAAGNGSSTLSSLAAFALAGGLVAILLSGCAGDPAKQLDGVVPDTAEAPKSPTQQIADRLFSEAIGPEARNVRLCMIGAGLTELVTWRVTDGGDGAYAATAAGQIMRVKAAIGGIDASAGNLWFETDVKHVTIQLASVLVEATKDRVNSLLETFAGGLNVPGIIQRVGVASGQVILADGIVRDVKRVVADISAGKLTIEQAKAACEARIDRNRARIGAILGEAPQAEQPLE